MAEALLRKHDADRFDSFRAGTDPKEIHLLMIQVLNEIGIDTSKLRSKDVQEYLSRLTVQHLIVVCDNVQ